MSREDTAPPSIGGLGKVRRQAVAERSQSWVKESLLAPGAELPLLVEPAVDGLDPVVWVTENRQRFEEQLRRHGGILFRGFDLGGVDGLQRFVEAASDRPMGYEDRSSPRSQVSGKVYTSTDHPADQTILPHNENSYSFAWPRKIFFYCVTPAEQGGATPLVDCRKVAGGLDPDLLERFRSLGVLYVRNFGDGFGLPWQAVFQTEDRASLEDYCQRHRIDWEWKDDGRLRTRQARPAVLTHPDTGELVWFNQALLFHPAGLDPAVRRELTAAFRDEDLPNNAYYGDGSVLEEPTLGAISDAYRAATVAFPWRTGDLLVLDNLLVAHGREPFQGPRKVVVSMAEPMTLDEV